MILANFVDYRQWPHPSPREMVRILSRGTSTDPILFRRQLPPGMLFVDHILRFNLFPLQHFVQRRGAILEALYLILKGFWFSPPELIMTSLFHFEEKIHRKHLSRAETIPLLFPRLLCHVLEYFCFPDEPHREDHGASEATFTVEKWQFVPRAPPLPADPPAEADPQRDPPQDQQPLLRSPNPHYHHLLPLTQYLLHQCLQPTPHLHLLLLQLTPTPLHHQWHLFTSMLRIFLPSWPLSDILWLHPNPSLLHKLPWPNRWLASKLSLLKIHLPLLRLQPSLLRFSNTWACHQSLLL